MMSKLNSVRQGTNTLRIVFIYACFASLWILLSDWAMVQIFRDLELINAASTLKGWVFVAVTSLLLYGLLRRGDRERQREQKLQIEYLHSLRLLKAISESSSDAIFAKDLNGRYLFCNSAAASVASKSAEQVLGRDDSELFPPDEAAQLAEIGHEIVASRSVSTGEEILTTVHGVRYFHAVKGPLFDDRDNIYGTFGISRDITEQRQFEAKLRESEQRNRAIVSALTEGLLVSDNKGQLIFCNPAAEKMLGVKLPELQDEYRNGTGRLRWSPVREDMSPLMFEEYPPVITLRTGEPQRRVVMGIQGQTSRVTWLLVNSEPIYSSVDGRIESVVTSFADITEIKRANQAMALQNATLKSIAESISLEQTVVQIAATFREKYPEGKIAITQVSTRGDALQLLASAGLPSDAVELLREIPLLEGAGASGTAAALRQPSTLDIASDLACVNFRELADLHGLNTWWSTPILDSSRRVLGTIEIFLKINFKPEIREQKIIDSLGQTLALEFSRSQIEGQSRKLALAVEQSPESIVITDLQGVIEYVNETFVRVSGYQREELIGNNSRILKSGRTPAENYRALWSTLERGQTWKGEFYNRRKDGREYVELSLVAPLRQSSGVITHYVAVKEDVTEKKRISAELESYRHHLEELVESRTKLLADAQLRAESANNAKSAFLANMSHEMRTPMNGMIGLTELMIRDNPTPLQADRLKKLEISAQHLLAIINDVLDLSKIEAGRVVLEKMDFRLKEIVDYVVAMIAEPAEKNGLSLIVDCEDAAMYFHGDPMRLRQALLNYASNAIKFTERGSVTLRVRLQKRREQKFVLRFEVEDTGIGISTENIARLFHRFEQSDISITRKYGGTGLGLAITRNLARLMDGDAGVDSELGRGSKFWFTAVVEASAYTELLPDAPIHIDAANTLRREHQGKRVLVVDDNSVNQEISAELLRVVGLEVDVATNGSEAVEKVSHRDYAAVLMDIQMPVLDGLGATRAIRLLPGKSALPVIALSANAYAEDRAACTAAGMNGFIAKPFVPNVLYLELLNWLAIGGAYDLARAASPEIEVSEVERRVPFDQTRFVAVIEHLMALLAAGDMAANELAEAERPLLHAGFGAAWTQLFHRIENFDYDRAFNDLRELLAKRSRSH